jgi:hypothetical protein
MRAGTDEEVLFVQSPFAHLPPTVLFVVLKLNFSFTSGLSLRDLKAISKTVETVPEIYACTSPQAKAWGE